MSRMLKALQQVGGANNSGETVRPLTREELAAFGLWHLTDPRPEDSTSSEADEPSLQESEPALPTGQPPEAELPPAEPAETAVSAPVSSAEVHGSCNTADLKCCAPAEGISEFSVMMGEPALGECAATSSELDRLLGDAVRPRQRQYRDLADALLARVSSGRPAALLFTHVSDLEGNSLILADLAVALSRRVSGELILVDADFQNPRLGQIFGVESDRTLWDISLGAADWRGVVQRTKAARVSLLPGGPSPAVPRPPRKTFQLAHLVDELRSQYDLVLLQAARVGFPEVNTLARHCDGTYLTVQLGCVSRRQVRRAASMLQRCGAALLGGVVIGG